MSTTLLRRLVPVVAVVALLSACDTAGDDSAQAAAERPVRVEPDAPTTAAPEPAPDETDEPEDGHDDEHEHEGMEGEPPPDEDATPVDPAPGTTVDPRAYAWESARVLGDDQRWLRLHFWKGVEPCEVLDDVVVDYGEDEVTVTLLLGRAQDAGDVACIEIVEYHSVTVALDEPIGRRNLVDGAA